MVAADSRVQVDERENAAIEFENVLKRRRLQYQQAGGSGQAGSEIEFERYMRVEFDQNVDPLEWWSTNKESYPVMAILVRKYLRIVGSSIGTHRAYSKEDCDDLRLRVEENAIYDMIVCRYAALALKIVETSDNQGVEEGEHMKDIE